MFCWILRIVFQIDALTRVISTIYSATSFTINKPELVEAQSLVVKFSGCLLILAISPQDPGS